MKKLVLLAALFILIPSVLADWFYNSESVVTNIKIYGDAEIVPLTPSGYVESAAVNMTFFPKQSYAQKLLKFETKPKAELAGDSLKFTWKNPEGRIGFSLDADVKTTNTIAEIREKIRFPVGELPEDIIQYTKPSETIDSGNNGIISIANELARGEDDLYSAVFKIADWTKNNINYNLSTLTADVSQKASWVLENRQGVCDELTSLFIALLRAVGIPARFVSGLSYTESELFPENWGSHGWAEVYFPGYGWVPFDVTYGEFGWVDPTHIKFKESVDSDEPSTYYNWIGRNADLKTGKLDIKGDTIEKAGYYRTSLKLEASAFKDAISFGSYNLVEAAIENPNDFYYATELQLSKPKEVKIIGMELKSILLLPNEKKKVFWILKLDGDLVIWIKNILTRFPWW
ncbi:transglutaminase domain-containing protein [Candidatus Woesearchaeota archaeon]|nr:transglutaminase domain-containing protein [Candidatus Woesearchaeota archaeon]